jgi:hypothetical protein
MDPDPSGPALSEGPDVATSGHDGPQDEGPAPSLASSAREVYADEPFAGTIFQKSGRSREWVDTVPKTDPTCLSELMESREVAGTVVIETHAGDTVEVQVGSAEEEPQEANAEAKRRWKQAGEAKARKELQKEKQRLRERLEDRLQTRQERIRQQEERITQLKDESDRLRREKAEKVEAEREKRREKVEAEREKRREKVSELREKVQELEKELLEAKSSENSSPFGKAVEKLVNDGAHQQLLAAVSGGGTSQPQQSQRAQPARQVQEAPAVAGDGRAGEPPQPEPRQNAQAAGQTGPDRRAPAGRDASGTESSAQTDEAAPGAGPGEDTPDGIPGEVDEEELKKAQIAKSGYVAIVQGREAELYEQLHGREDVAQWGQEEWMEVLHAFAILCEEKGVEPRAAAELVAGDLDHYLTPGGAQMLAAAKTMSSEDVAALLFDQMSADVGADVKGYVTSVIGELQELL